MLLQLVFTVLFLLAKVSCVSRDNFKTCDQSGFCKRHRAMQPGASPYVVLMDSIKMESSRMVAQVLNKNSGVKLLLEVWALEHNTARVKIDELAPIKQRYEIPVGDVLVGDPKVQNLNILERGHGSVSLGFEKNKIVVSSEPFRIDFISQDEPVISLNAEGLLKFEHYRKKAEETEEKNEDPAPPAEQEDEQKNEEQEEGEEPAEEKAEEKKEQEEPALWEETFKTFHDAKPYGRYTAGASIVGGEVQNLLRRQAHGPTSVGLDISFPGFDYVYGIPEHADSMALKTTRDGDPYRLFNLDVFEYELYNPMALYGAVPVMLAHKEDKTVGVFWHNAAETWVDISSTTADKNFFSKIADLVKGGSSEMPQTDTHWFSESGVIDVFVMLGPSAKDVFYQYAKLTGTTDLPPIFGLAYHQCRWNYNDQEDVKNVDATMDEHNIPFDVIWLDIEHTDGKRYFTWDADKFPNSVEMINNVASKGRKMVTIVDPHLKSDDNYRVYKEAKDQDLMVKSNSGGNYDGWCWPGTSNWPDFCDPAVREWWAQKFLYNDYAGSTGDLFTWNDMNEPSVFNGPEITFHKDVVHKNGFENRDVHNLYGMYVQQATMEGQLLRSENKERAFVLTRAFFAGSQRFGAVWTGDNSAEWGHLKISNPMLLSLNLVGITHSGADVGGFFKNPDTELLTRWYQAGAFQPFFRAHAHIDTKRREPYLQPDENKKIIQEAIKARYSYLPFWYTLFYQAEESGFPAMRPLWVEFPADKQTFNMDDQYLIGPSLLVKPITDSGQRATQVYFPGQGEIWYDIDTFKQYVGVQTTSVDAPLSKIPVYQRGGSIIPRKLRMRRSSSLMVNDPFTLFVCLDKKGAASGSVYVDDYHTFNYRKGQYLYRGFEFSNNEFVSQSLDNFGQHSTKEWIERIVVVGLQKEPSSVALTVGAEVRSLQFAFNKDTQTLTIRKPGVNLATDFKIKLT